MLNPLDFFKPSRLFAMRPLALSSLTFWIVLIVFALVLVSGGVFWWLKVKKKKGDRFTKKFYGKMINLSFVMGVIGFIMLGFRQGRVQFFAARFWLLFWGIGFLVWLGFNIRYILKTAPQRRVAKEADELFDKYLPKKKK